MSQMRQTCPPRERRNRRQWCVGNQVKGVAQLFLPPECDPKMWKRQSIQIQLPAWEDARITDYAQHLEGGASGIQALKIQIIGICLTEPEGQHEKVYGQAEDSQGGGIQKSPVCRCAQ